MASMDPIFTLMGLHNHPSGLLQLTNSSKQEIGHAFYRLPIIFNASSSGLLCSHYYAAARPSMRQVMRYLDRDALLPEMHLDTIGLVQPCKGTKISEWGRGTYLYNQLLRRASAALQNGGGSIQAVLWYQGESDTVNLQDAALYKGRLGRFFMDLRADLQSPLLPIIQVALASGQGPYIEKVREAQLGIDLAHVKCVDAKGLQLEPDHLHLTTQAEVQLGQMLADAFLHTLPTPLQSNAPKTSHN
ncbi:putative carbohydrate esterase [Camellia lanceoleosa]|uniref:Carbohydrate esterase n=1 Tax=Camellia lanceoleosa TaxID=1840588 RepID=A0ACC0HRD6_9ERIC|nr:putative carbohydrate esterase [Camellia lanceoleosa]